VLLSSLAAFSGVLGLAGKTGQGRLGTSSLHSSNLSIQIQILHRSMVCWGWREGLVGATLAQAVCTAVMRLGSKGRFFNVSTGDACAAWLVAMLPAGVHFVSLLN
jgi:hypothetical protein